MIISPRLRRVFHPISGRCIDVAVDHGLFGEPAFLPGIEDMRAVVERLVAAAPDAIQLSVGQAPLLTDRTGERPALVLRSDVANVYGSEPAAHPFSLVVDGVVAKAVVLDAACVCVNLFDIPGADDLRRQCVENIARLRSECDRAGMGLMVEPLAFKPGRGAPEPEGDAERIAALVRQATELGADVIKADPSDGLCDYRRIVTVARVPLPVRGGGRVDDVEILRRQSVFATVTGPIFEFGFADAILQMWAAFLAERAGALDGGFGCATPREALTAHRLAESCLALAELRRRRATRGQLRDPGGRQDGWRGQACGSVARGKALCRSSTGGGSSSCSMRRTRGASDE